MANYLIKQYSGYCEIIFNGDITLTESFEYKEELKKHFSLHNCYHILINLERVEFMDSSGLGMLISFFKDVSEHNGKIIYFGLQPYIKKLLDLVKLNHVFTIETDKQIAINKLEV